MHINHLFCAGIRKGVFARSYKGITEKQNLLIYPKEYTILSHHAAEVEPNGGEIEGEHAVEIKPTT